MRGDGRISGSRAAYEERGRGIIAQNGQSVVIDPERKRWLVTERDPVNVDIAEWHEYTVIAQGNHLIHKIDGQVAADLLDFDETARSLEGLLAFQIQRGPAMTVQIKDVMLKELPEGGVVSFEKSAIPSDAQIIEAKKPAGKGKANKANAKAKQDEFKAKVSEGQAAVASQWEELQANYNQQVAQIKSHIEAKKGTFEVNRAMDRAFDAESYAVLSIAFADMAIDEAEIATLEAIEARAYADALAQTKMTA